MSRALVAALGLGMLVGACGGENQAFGDVTFQYSLFIQDGAGGVQAASDCEALGIEFIRLFVGDDDNADGVLDDAEVTEQISDRCIVGDANANGVFDANELGEYGDLTFLVNDYDAFAIELEDFNGVLVPFSPLGSGAAPLARVTFVQDIEILEGDLLDIPFVGQDAAIAQTLDELQIELP
jgi:hypothetical protein